MRIGEIVLEDTASDDVGYEARALDCRIFTQGDEWDDPKAMARDSVLCHFKDGSVPGIIKLHLIREDAIAA